MSGFEHQCLGCQRQIADWEPHIHVGMDDWSAKEGLETFGIDLTFAFCAECTERAEKGWIPEAHPIEEDDEL